MLPSDWGDGSLPPAWFELPEQWDSLKERYETLVLSPVLSRAPLEAVFATARASNPNRAVIEREYIDADFRNEYANFYAMTFRRGTNRCERVHFSGPEGYIGFSIMRPVLGRPVSRTMLRPPKALHRYISCIATTEVHPYGATYEVEAFPYISQDAQFGTCAHASIWMTALYHHDRFGTHRVMTSDIAQAAATHEMERLVPSSGLTLFQMSFALRELGLPVIPYDISGLPPGETVEKIACRYLNSRLPVILITPRHATVLVGYQRRDDGGLTFIRNDDQRGPYRPVENWRKDELGKWQALYIPLPGRIYMSGESAEQLGERVLPDVVAQIAGLGIVPDFRIVSSAMTRRKIRYRTYAIQANDYRDQLIARGLPPDLSSAIRYSPTPKWIWIVELQEKREARNDRPCVIGEVAIDATSDPWTAGALFGYVPGVFFRLSELGALPTFHRSTHRPGELFETGTALRD